MNLFTRKNLHRFFEAGSLLKAFDSIIEIGLGIFFYVTSTETVNKIVMALFGDELSEQPHDFITNILFHNFHGLTPDSQSLWAFIFASHGIVKILMIIGLLKKKLWTYPLAALAFGYFVAYQTIHILNTPSILLILLTLYDTLFVALIIHEYQYQKERMGAVS